MSHLRVFDAATPEERLNGSGFGYGGAIRKALFSCKGKSINNAGDVLAEIDHARRLLILSSVPLQGVNS